MSLLEITKKISTKMGLYFLHLLNFAVLQGFLKQSLKIGRMLLDFLFEKNIGIL